MPWACLECSLRLMRLEKALQQRSHCRLTGVECLRSKCLAMLLLCIQAGHSVHCTLPSPGKQGRSDSSNLSQTLAKISRFKSTEVQLFFIEETVCSDTHHGPFWVGLSRLTCLYNFFHIEDSYKTMVQYGPAQHVWPDWLDGISFHSRNISLCHLKQAQFNIDISQRMHFWRIPCAVRWCSFIL